MNNPHWDRIEKRTATLFQVLIDGDLKELVFVLNHYPKYTEIACDHFRYLYNYSAQEADIYFMDEPFQGVDAKTEKAIIALLKKLKEENKTVIVVHHDLETVEAYFDWVTLLNMQIVDAGPVKKVITKENLAKTYDQTKLQKERD